MSGVSKYDKIDSLIMRAIICISSPWTKGNKSLILLIDNFNTIYCKNEIDYYMSPTSKWIVPHISHIHNNMF